MMQEPKERLAVFSAGVPVHTQAARLAVSQKSEVFRQPVKQRRCAF